MHDGSASRRSLLVCAPMKKPSLKRRKAPTPQQLAAGPKPEKRKRNIGRALGTPFRLLATPFVKVAQLKGPARLVVWGAIAVIVVIAALQLRGGRDDDKLVREALASYEQASDRKDYQKLCDDLLASSYVRQAASTGLPCEVALRTALENVNNPKLTVLGVEVNGDRALARVRGTAAGQVPGEDTYTLIREDGAWKILPTRPSTSPGAAAP
jgi:hypothetical protein